MNTKWRPKGWNNPNRIVFVQGSENGDPTAFSAYEAGADAILEALGKSSLKGKGIIVFIPDNNEID